MSPEAESNRKISDDGFFNGQWIRRATAKEKNYELLAKLRMRLIWLQLRLKSKNPLNEDQIRETLNHMYRKFPSLNHCYGYRDGETWIRRAQNPEIDFEVLQGKSFDYVRKLLENYLYNTDTGPMFCARLLLGHPPDDMIIEEGEDPDLHNVSYMFFGLPHAFVDARTNAHLMKYFIKILNDVISDKPIDDKPLGVLVSDEPILEVIREKMALIKEDSSLEYEIHEAENRKGSFSPDIRNFRSVTVTDIKQKYLIKIFDRKTTSEILTKIKEELVSVGSLFVALVNVAIVDLLSENGIVRESYGIKAGYLNDMRKYWKVGIPESFGEHIAPSFLYKETPRDARDSFWKYARSVHEEFRRDIKSGKVVLQKAYEALYPSSEKTSTEETLQQPQPIIYDYMMNVIPDNTPIITAEGDHVRVTHILSGNKLAPLRSVFLVQTNRFRGRLTIIFSFEKTSVQEEIIERIFEITLQTMRGIFSKE